MKIFHLIHLFIGCFLLSSCTQQKAAPPQAFQQKWNAGKAELNSYTLQQARYGEIRKGEAVLIFVTEDFSSKKLVKLDDPSKTNEKTRVLKMNMTKKFITGIYPYSMMLSVFTPVSRKENVKTLKADCSSQEWCGHTFSQLSLKGDNYRWQLHSYFEQESEQNKNLEAGWLEDEMWNRIRIDPATLPQGKVAVLPGLLYQRLSHTPLQKEEAILTLSKADSFFIKDSTLQLYTIHYPAAQRTLQIYFTSKFPYSIVGWQETYPDGNSNPKKMLVTKALLKKQVWLDYWKHNRLADSTYRDTLQLMRNEP